MAMTMHVDIVSLEDELFSGRAEMLQASGVLGELGIFPFHAPLLTELLPGPIRVVKPGGEEEILYISGGLLEVQPEIVTILSDTAVRGHDLDEAQALAAQERARQVLADNSADVDYTRARAELARAAGLLRTLRELRKNIK